MGCLVSWLKSEEFKATVGESELQCGEAPQLNLLCGFPPPRRKSRCFRRIKLGNFAPASSVTGGEAGKKSRIQRSNILVLPRHVQFQLFNWDCFKEVRNHRDVRGLLGASSVAGKWAPQDERDGFVEYWFYVRSNVSLEMLKHPDEKVRLPFPFFHDAPADVLQDFVDVVNRVAGSRIISKLNTKELEEQLQLRMPRVILSRPRV